MDAMDRFYRAGVVPVVVLKREEDALPTARALLAGGIDVMEITLRTDAALGAIGIIRDQCPQMLVGAGTVTHLEQGRRAVDAGASFIVSPGLDAALVSWCLENRIPVIPGCVTPTEIMEGMALGLTTFKFFPADVYGGLQAMKALSGPFGAIGFIPTGGVNGENLAQYLQAPFVHAVGGSWLCPASEIEKQNWKFIEEISRQAKIVSYKTRNL